MDLNTLQLPDFDALLKPETDLERHIIGQADIVKGLLWGEPRYGHPEGKVIFHVNEIYTNIEALSHHISEEQRSQLRLITLLHDSFKYQEDKSFPRDWSKHHGILARNHAADYIKQETILDIIELHDEAYYCWRMEVLDDKTRKARMRMDRLLERIEPCLQLFYIFFKCDTATGDKTQAPVKWFEKKIKGIDWVSFKKM